MPSEAGIADCRVSECDRKTVPRSRTRNRKCSTAVCGQSVTWDHKCVLLSRPEANWCSKMSSVTRSLVPALMMLLVDIIAAEAQRSRRRNRPRRLPRPRPPTTTESPDDDQLAKAKAKVCSAAFQSTDNTSISSVANCDKIAL